MFFSPYARLLVTQQLEKLLLFGEILVGNGVNVEHQRPHFWSLGSYRQGNLDFILYCPGPSFLGLVWKKEDSLGVLLTYIEMSSLPLRDT